MKTPLTKDQLDGLGCGIPNCGHDHTVVYLHARCHVAKALEVFYNKQTGILTVACSQCKSVVANIQVAA